MAAKSAKKPTKVTSVVISITGYVDSSDKGM
jgi:hypothetical protein